MNEDYINKTYLFPWFFLFSNFEFLIFRFFKNWFSKFYFSDFRFLIFSGIRICTKPLGVLYTPHPQHTPQIKSPCTSHGHGFLFQIKRTYNKTKNAHLRETKTGWKEKRKAIDCKQRKESEKERHSICIIVIIVHTYTTFILFILFILLSHLLYTYNSIYIILHTFTPFVQKHA